MYIIIDDVERMVLCYLWTKIHDKKWRNISIQFIRVHKCSKKRNHKETHHKGFYVKTLFTRLSISPPAFALQIHHRNLQAWATFSFDIRDFMRVFVVWRCCVYLLWHMHAQIHLLRQSCTWGNEQTHPCDWYPIW